METIFEFKNAAELAERIEQLNEGEKRQLIEVRKAEVKHQEAEYEEHRARRELLRMQRDKAILCEYMNALRMEANAKAYRDLAATIDQAAPVKN